MISRYFQARDKKCSICKKTSKVMSPFCKSQDLYFTNQESFISTLKNKHLTLDWKRKSVFKGSRHIILKFITSLNQR